MYAQFKDILSYDNVKKIYLVIILFSSLGFAQDPERVKEINNQFEQAKSYINTGNPDKALPIINKIHKDSKEINYKPGITRVGHMLSIIYFNSSDYKKVITLDDEFLKVGNEIKDYEKLSHIHRLKGAAYSELGLLNQGSEERILALNYAKKMPAGNNKQYALGIIYGNLADHFIKSTGSKDSVFENLKKSISEAEKINEADESFISRKHSLIAYSSMILANEYSELGNTKEAENYYLKSLDIHNSKPIPLIEKVILLSQLGSFYYDQKKYDKAIKYAELGVSIEKKASFPQTRKDLYETLSKSYLEIQQTKNSKKYLNLFTSLNDSITNVDKQAVDTALKTTISKKEKIHYEDANKKTLIYIIFSFSLIASSIFFFIYYKKKKQNQIKKIEAILEQLKAKQNDENKITFIEKKSINKEDNIKEELDQNEDEINLLMSPEAEEKLIEKLHNFEKSNSYLERKVSLSYVAAEIQSNTKYLSYIIKKHRGKDFNKYINDLRINYIVQKINDDPKYRQYKINFLAEETGFSSHSKFATVFKNTVGVSPSEFIKYFENNINP